MFLATALLYPCVLAALCAGAGLLVDRWSGRFLPAPLLLSVGAAALIALSQLSTYVAALAPATPYLMTGFALLGFALAQERLRGLASRLRLRAWPAGASALVYLIALAPVLLAGRASFSSYMTLADSAVHMMGADFLLRHGQDYTHLDLRNSYGQFVNNYYNSSYPSGADTLFGGSAFLLGLPLIWAFQPFNAFILATAAGPAWLLVRRIGLHGAWAALASVTAVLPALVYAYALFGSIKELTALSMILTLACLVVLHGRWLKGAPARAVPFSLVLAAGVSALGIAFGAWALVVVLVLAAVLFVHLRRGRVSARPALLLVLVGAITLLIAAWPTWSRASAAFTIATDIAYTANPGNLHAPLRASQVLGIWLGGSYKLAPTGSALALTHALMVLALLAAVLGAVHLLRIGARALAGWIALMLLAWFAVTRLVTTWADAKTLVLTSPAVLLLAWGGVAGLRSLAPAPIWRAAAALLALALAGGVLVSDAMQYHSSNLAPTARYDELASLNSRFAGRGPALFTDFDEYAMYELRGLDIGGPDFKYPPAALAASAGGYGEPVQLDRAPAAALLAYPLIITRRDPAASRPPSAYRLAWEGAYYQVWERRSDAPAATLHLALAGSPLAQCRRIERLAARARGPFRGRAQAEARLLAAEAPALVRIDLARAHRPAGWGRERAGLVMKRAGTLSLALPVPYTGRWALWLRGQIMPTVHVSLDGRALASIGGQLSGNSLVPDTVPPLQVRLSAGAHRLSVTRPRSNLTPGDGGSAVLDAVLLTPAAAGAQSTLRSASVSGASALCGRRYQWVELVRAL